MEYKLRQLLADGVDSVDKSFNTLEILRKLSCLYEQISLFNPSYGLVNAQGEELVVKHILDCLAPAPYIRQFVSEKSVFADLGSGSGLPGLVLASVFPQNKFFLVERMGRRCQFLNNTIVLMGLKDRVSVLQSDLSEVKQKFDIVTFRAFRPIRDIAKDLDRITEPESCICTYKSSEENLKEEIASLNGYSKDLFSDRCIDYSVPFLDAKRTLLILKKNVQ